jgi:hypothetical protein
VASPHERALSGAPPGSIGGTSHGAGRAQAVDLASRRKHLGRPGRWLALSMVALGGLAAAAAVVSYSAQYRMVYVAKRSVPAAALEAGIPDVAALIFAALGIALALHGKRALRAAGAECLRGGDFGLDERARGGSWLAGRGYLGDAAGRLRAGVGHRDRCRAGLDDRPAAALEGDAG